MNIKHLVKNGSLQYKVASDGNCGFKAGTTHIFKDSQYGIPFRKLINNHIADRFYEYYCNRISFPYTRKIGVKGETITFDVGETENLIKFLRTDKAASMWMEFEDLEAMANLYQIMIKVITINSDNDENPKVNTIGPDPALNTSKLLPGGSVSDLTLLHYDDLHFNLIIDEDSDLATIGILSDYVENLDDGGTREIIEADNKESRNKREAFF